ncbi:hypothetical protein LXL04_005449 [Taraxacum kok-saghyz]
MVFKPRKVHFISKEKVNISGDTCYSWLGMSKICKYLDLDLELVGTGGSGTGTVPTGSGSKSENLGSVPVPTKSDQFQFRPVPVPDPKTRDPPVPVPVPDPEKKTKYLTCWVYKMDRMEILLCKVDNDHKQLQFVFQKFDVRLHGHTIDLLLALVSTINPLISKYFMQQPGIGPQYWVRGVVLRLTKVYSSLHKST